MRMTAAGAVTTIGAAISSSDLIADCRAVTKMKAPHPAGMRRLFVSGNAEVDQACLALGTDMSTCIQRAKPMTSTVAGSAATAMLMKMLRLGNTLCSAM